MYYTHSPPLPPSPLPPHTTTSCMSTVVFCETLFSTYLIRLLNLGCSRTDAKVIDKRIFASCGWETIRCHSEAKTKSPGIMKKKIPREVTERNTIMWPGALCTKCSCKQNVGNPYMKRGVCGRDTARIEVCNILIETHSRNRSPGLKCGLDNTSVKGMWR